MPELVTSRLQLIQDLCKAIVAHLGEGLRPAHGLEPCRQPSEAAADWPRWIPQW